jgi:hypothetical protein
MMRVTLEQSIGILGGEEIEKHPIISRRRMMLKSKEEEQK